MASIKGKKLAALFFDSRQCDNNMWKCTACSEFVKQVMGKGYTNLCAHINVKHKDMIQERLQNSIRLKSKTLNVLTAPSKIQRVHGWIRCIVLCMLPFSFCENPIIRESFKYPPISRSLLTEALQKLTKVVEKRIANILPEKFSIQFDGWSGGDTHYVSIFAAFPATNANGYVSYMLACSPMENETALTASEHYEFLSFVLGLFNKSLVNVVAITGDNCNTNRSLARLGGLNFVGCASHRFNLAVKDILKRYEHSIGMIQTLMKKLSFQIPAAKLRMHTPLKATQRNETRWSSTYTMLSRFLELLPFLPRIDDDDVQLLIPSDQQNTEIRELCVKLAELDSVTKTLQNASTTMADVRALFDAVLDHYPFLHMRLSENADIVENKHFERAIVKVQNGEEKKLTGTEMRSIQHLKGSDSDQNEQELSQQESLPVSFADSVLKKRRLNTKSTYMSLKFIVPTSNICERCFSKAGYCLGDRRKSISPANFEAQLFLNVNQCLWGIEEVAEALE